MATLPLPISLEANSDRQEDETDRRKTGQTEEKNHLYGHELSTLPKNEVDLKTEGEIKKEGNPIMKMTQKSI